MRLVGGVERGLHGLGFSVICNRLQYLHARRVGGVVVRLDERAVFVKDDRLRCWGRCGAAARAAAFRRSRLNGDRHGHLQPRPAEQLGVAHRSLAVGGQTAQVYIRAQVVLNDDVRERLPRAHEAREHLLQLSRGSI